MKEQFKTRNESETLQKAEEFAQSLKPGDVVALSGELGAGKTVFARGIARALGITSEVASPTFTLINEYRGTYTLRHMDFYRLNNPREILDIGVEDYFYDDGICLVEWPEKLGGLFPSDAIRVTIRHNGAESREISISRGETV